MNNTILDLMSKIGQTAYIVRDYNKYYDKMKSYLTIFDTWIVVEEFIIDSFIVDKEGVHLAENGHDGYNKITTYHHLTLNDLQDCEVFLDKNELVEFMNGIICADYKFKGA